MSTTFWPRGLGATGSLLGTKENLVTTGNVWFVDWTAGVDAASPRGLNEKAPLKTLTRAITNAVEGDIIVLFPTHTETISNNNPLTMAKRLIILGSGQSAGIPCSQITLDYAGQPAWEIGSSECEGSVISNIRFLTGPGLEVSDVGLSIAVEGITLHACYFDVKTITMLKILGAQGCLIHGCSFVNVSTPTPSGVGVYLSGTSHVRFVEPVFDAGASGWLAGIALDANSGGQQTDLRLEDVTLLRGADISVYPTSSGAYNLKAESTGQGRVLW